jgi:hypothetical protein
MHLNGLIWQNPAGFLLLIHHVHAQSVSTQLDVLLPLAAQWAAEQQEIILRDGVPLSMRETADALKIGVKDPERVRLLQVEIIPSPNHPILQAAYHGGKLVPTAPRGLTVQYGVFVRADYWRDRTLILHELVHVAQYERLGGIEQFLREYLMECATVGYGKSPMEREANEEAMRILDKERLVRH